MKYPISPPIGPQAAHPRNPAIHLAAPMILSFWSGLPCNKSRSKPEDTDKVAGTGSVFEWIPTDEKSAGHPPLPLAASAEPRGSPVRSPPQTGTELRLQRCTAPLCDPDAGRHLPGPAHHPERHLSGVRRKNGETRMGPYPPVRPPWPPVPPPHRPAFPPLGRLVDSLPPLFLLPLLHRTLGRPPRRGRPRPITVHPPKKICPAAFCKAYFYMLCPLQWHSTAGGDEMDRSLRLQSHEALYRYCREDQGRCHEDI